MKFSRRSTRFPVLLAVLSLLSTSALAAAQASGTQPAPAGQPVGGARAIVRPADLPPLQAVAPAGAISEFDADRVRQQLYEVLEKYPPSLGRILKMDPSLLTNEAYLAPYPGVAAYLAQHPEIVRNPSFYLERFGIEEQYGYPMSAEAQKRRDMQEMLAAFAAFVIFLVVTAVVIWLIRTIIETRRWNRMSKTQADVHTKLLDRFSSNEELLAYIQTPVGRRFLESGPVPLPDEVRPLGAPFSRILFSMQAGIVLAVGAVGLLFLSWKLDDDVSAFFMVIGIVSLAVGVGFLVSSMAAYAISSRLGALRGSDSEHA